MRQMSVISGHPIFKGFRRLTGCQRDSRDSGVTLTIFVCFLELNMRASSTLASRIKT